MRKNIENIITSLGVKEMRADEKQTVWANLIGFVHAPLGKKFMGLGTRLAVSSLAAIVIITSGSVATAAAADKAKPGDALFPLDVALERVRIVFSSESKKDELRVRFANERFDEAKIAVAYSYKSTVSADGSNSGDATSTEDVDVKSVKKAEYALTVALDRLSIVKAELEANGNVEAAASVGEVIDRLTALAEDHIANLQDVEAKVKLHGNGGVEAEIKTSGSDLREKFKLDYKPGKGSENGNGKKFNDDDDEDEDDDDNDAHEAGIRGKAFGLSIRTLFKSSGNATSSNSTTTRQFGEKVEICHVPFGNPSGAHTIKVGAPAKYAHFAHGDKAGECADIDDDNDSDDDDEDDDDNDIQDIIAPIISSITNVFGTSTAQISWQTNEQADSKVYYNTASPVGISGNATSSYSSTMTANHSIQLSGLTASTTYYYVAASGDASGNIGTSTEHTFTTLGITE